MLLVGPVKKPGFDRFRLIDKLSRDNLSPGNLASGGRFDFAIPGALPFSAFSAVMSKKREETDKSGFQVSGRRFPFTFDPAYFTELPVGTKLDLSRVSVLRLPNGRFIVLRRNRQHRLDGGPQN